MIIGQRLRRGACGSARGAARMIADALATVDRLRTHAAGTSGDGAPKVVVRGDSAFYGHPTIGAALRAGADVSVTVRLTSTIKRAIASIGDDKSAWTPIEYTDAVYDEATDTWISRAEVAEIPFTAFASQKKSHHTRVGWWCAASPTCARPRSRARARCSTSGGSRRSSPPPTPTTSFAVAADKTHRQHAVIEQVHADLKNSALAHLPSNSFSANAAWLVCAVMAFNLTRAAGTLTADPKLTKATTGTLRRTIVSVPARIASSARRLTLHLPQNWPWETAWITLFDNAFGRSYPIIV
ncbi:IS1380 family transposase [Rhodococcus sp. ACS1]|uniref:IS1380 family transposase n=1 Tax=Rhodococcus sp. ACS1 TaxID=2028570 RepID=UPI0015C6A79D|nr:IS1380 family transposase [Rhodococcus sp. ACS1]